MKNTTKLFYFALLFVTIGCSEDFLETEPTEFITQEQLASESVNRPDLIIGTVNGIYSLMFETGTGGTTGHNDFGQKGYDIMSDMLSGDVALTQNTYNWYRNLVDYQSTIDFTNNNNYIGWRYYYRIIRSTNAVIDALGGEDAVPALDENKWSLGQAKALRAYSYYYLAQLYTKEYEPSKDILPLYLLPTDVNLPKSTTEQIYVQMEKDLTSAISLLSTFNRSAKNEVNQYVAKGLLAYVYATMGNKDGEAKILTQDIITNGGFPLTTTAQLTGGFNDVNTGSWMWGVDITTDQGLDLISWWGQMDLFTYSYAWAGDKKAIDLNLFNSIPANDARKGQFTTNATYYLMPVNKFYDSGRVIGGQRNITTDYIYMRVDEMYLLNAEVSARSGDEANARIKLKALLANRLPSTTYVDALTGTALLDEIYKQTRIEFWGEGKSYLAMKRFKKTINRGTNHIFQAGVAVPYNDARLKFSIPQAEIQNNPNINDQN